MVASPDLSSLTPDFSSVTTGVLAVAGAIIGVYVAWKGARIVINALVGGALGDDRSGANVRDAGRGYRGGVSGDSDFQVRQAEAALRWADDNPPAFGPEGKEIR